ncbi:MAG: twin-arginine translocase TatA/TatE family subunit [Natronomonas sp.]
MPTTLPLQFGLPGGPELLIILFIAVLLFGANKLPALARSSGQAMGEFKRGRAELEDELKRGVEDGTDDGDLSVDGADPELDSEAELEETERSGEAELAS